MFKGVKKLFTNCLCMALIAAMAFLAVGCGAGDTESAEKTDSNKITSTRESEQAQHNVAATDSGGDIETKTSGTSEPETDDTSDVSILGEGSTSFDFAVTDSEGSESKFEIHTDKKTVGEALSELELIEGEEGDYGLYVKTVNGITVDYDKDGAYWAFYVGGEYAQTGVDGTEIKDGESYSFKVQK